MSAYEVTTIQLSGEDAINFANALYRPTVEQIRKHNEIFEVINNSITIAKNGEDYELDIADLDLSFLDDKITNSKISMEITVGVKVKDVFCSALENHGTKAVMAANTTENYCELVSDEIYNWAA